MCEITPTLFCSLQEGRVKSLAFTRYESLNDVASWIISLKLYHFGAYWAYCKWAYCKGLLYWTTQFHNGNTPGVQITVSPTWQDFSSSPHSEHQKLITHARLLIRQALLSIYRVRIVSNFVKCYNKKDRSETASKIVLLRIRRYLSKTKLDSKTAPCIKSTANQAIVRQLKKKEKEKQQMQDVWSMSMCLERAWGQSLCYLYSVSSINMQVVKWVWAFQDWHAHLKSALSNASGIYASATRLQITACLSSFPSCF